VVVGLTTISPLVIINNFPAGRVWVSPATANEEHSTDFGAALLNHGD